MRVLVVGQAPARSTRSGAAALQDSASGDRLERLLGLQPGTLLAFVETANLLDCYPGEVRPGQSGDRFDWAEARRGAERLDLDGVDLLVLLGAAVARAFRVPEPAGLLSATTVRGVRAVVLPHPSGASRWWNDRANRNAARRFVEAEVPTLSGGLFR